MRYSEFQNRLAEAVGHEVIRDRETGLFVVRAFGKWRGLDAIAYPPGLPDGRIITHPFIAVVSSPEEDPRDRRYAVYLGDTLINDERAPAVFRSASAEAKPMNSLVPDFVAIKQTEELGLPDIAFIDGNPDTLAVVGQPTLPGRMCHAHELLG